ncbi:hypothetical protein VNO78_29044 [Psophocarpus tetragonolobus]|uniref:Uncharacterized protein n=1 Tax=Psophocarpus tetragonolobus TaxID=3891 RepID=A0AAN9X080_PSOTE
MNPMLKEMAIKTKEKEEDVRHNAMAKPHRNLGRERVKTSVKREKVRTGRESVQSLQRLGSDVCGRTM